MASQELKILISAVNDSKGVMQEVMRGLSDIAGHVKDLKTSVEKSGLGEAVNEQVRETKEARKDVAALSEVLGGLNNAANLTARGLKFLAGGFLALKSVQFIKDLADTAARTETLGIVLNTVGVNAGYTRAQIQETDKAVQKLGITAASARQSLTTLIQADIPINFGAPLARAAQDLAVIAGQNSSETFSRLITNIQQLDTMGLRFMGIMVNKEQVFAKAAQETGKAITGNAQKIVFANAVLAEASKLQGIYEASMQSSSKMLASMPRHIESMKVALGNQLLPAYVELIRLSTQVLKSLSELAETFGTATTSSELFGTTMAQSADGTNALSDAIGALVDTIKDATKWLQENKETVEEVGKVLLAVFVGLAIGKAITASIGAYQAMRASLLSLARAAAFMGPYLVSAAVGLKAMAASVVAVTGPFGAAALALAALGTAAYVAYNRIAEGQKKIQTNVVEDQVQAYVTKMAEQAKLLAENAEAQDKLAKARNKAGLASTLAEKADADAELKKAEATAKNLGEQLRDNRKKLKDMETTLDTMVREGKLTPDQKVRVSNASEAAAKIQRDALAVIKNADLLREALDQAGVDLTKFETGVTAKFKTAMQGIALGVDSLLPGVANVSEGLDALVEAYTASLRTISTGKELELADQIGEALKTKAVALGLSVGSQLEASLAAAREKLLDQRYVEDQGGNEAVALVRRRAKELDDANLAIAKVTQRIAQDRRDYELGRDKEAYDQGLIDLTTYFDRRIAAARAKAADQIAISKQEREALESVRELASPSERPALDLKLQQSRAEEAAAIEAAAFDEARINDERLAAYRDLQDEVRRLKSEIEGLTGGEVESEIAALNLRYEEMARRIGKSTEAIQLLQEKWKLDVTIRFIELMNEKLQRQVALQNALIDVASAENHLRSQQGIDTELEAETRRNALVRQRMFLKEQELAREKDLLATWEALEGSQGRNAQASQEKIARLRADLLYMQAEIHTVGDTLRTSLTDAVSRGLEDGLNGGSWKDAITGIFDDFRKSINRVIAKEASENLTRAIVEATGGQGSSIFDKMGKVVQPGETETKPMYVTDVSKVTDDAPTGTETSPLHVLVQNLPEPEAKPTPSVAQAPAVAAEQRRLQSIAPVQNPTNVDTFVQKFFSAAEKASEQIGVDPSIILGQWGLETGWGKSIIPGTNNLGNIKDFSGKGVTATDNMTGSVDKYRKYESPEEFALQYSGLLLSKYPNATDVGKDSKAFAQGVKGYAEDPQYAKKLVAAAEMVSKSLDKHAAAVQKGTPDKAKEDPVAVLAENSSTKPLYVQEVAATTQTSPSGAGGASFLDNITPLLGGLLGSGNGGGYGGMAPILGMEMLRKGGPLSTLFGGILGFANGGRVRGPGTGTSDSIPALIDGKQFAAISSGEFIMPAEETAKHLPLLEALRQGQVKDPSVIGYAGGGLAGFFGGALLGKLGLGQLAGLLNRPGAETYYGDPRTPPMPDEERESERLANNAFATSGKDDWSFADGGEVPRPGLTRRARRKQRRARFGLGAGALGLALSSIYGKDPKEEAKAAKPQAAGDRKPFDKGKFFDSLTGQMWKFGPQGGLAALAINGLAKAFLSGSDQQSGLGPKQGTVFQDEPDVFKIPEVDRLQAFTLSPLAKKLRGFADGGLFRGHGTGTSDSNLIAVSDGEHVTKAAQTKKWLPLLDAINSGALDKHTANLSMPRAGRNAFANGGEVVGANSVVAASVGTQVGKQLTASEQRRGKEERTLGVNVHPDALNMTMQSWLEGEFGRMLASR